MSAPDDAGVRFPPPLIFLSFILLGMGLDHLFAIAPLPLSTWLRWSLATLFGATGLTLVVGALSLFRRAGTPPEPWRPTKTIAESGIYGRTRNPMYLGMACLHLSAAIGFESLGALILLLPAMIIIDRAIVKREEAYLSRRFGESYTAYKERVPRWF
ncbi:methyltransferase family protein [Sphingosinicella humi]|nr:isoprenylcysteine carboxylmethyltransferase family protein [Sphingosinicella humi]